MRRFLRRTAAREPLAVTMTGLRMGERLLQVGVADAALAAALAVRPGMSGHSAVVVGDAHAEERARAIAADAGALVDVQRAPLGRMPFADATFDVVIVHGPSAEWSALDAAARAGAMRECHRVLRGGGRVVALEPGTATGLSALFRRAPASPSDDVWRATESALMSAGFKPVRLLADREGYRFLEGLKT